MSGPALDGDTDAAVIAAFPATGKTWLKHRGMHVLDSDSSVFSWVQPGVRHPDWPQNYMGHIERGLRNPLVDAVLVSTHAEVRAALVERGIPFMLVYPDRSLREEYRQRMIERGSPPTLIAKVIDELWDTALDECEAQEDCDQIVLGTGQYLSDVVGL